MKGRRERGRVAGVFHIVTVEVDDNGGRVRLALDGISSVNAEEIHSYRNTMGIEDAIFKLHHTMTGDGAEVECCLRRIHHRQLNNFSETSGGEWRDVKLLGLVHGSHGPH
ncbi:hypothetical protein ACH5RR_015150 [Cinchona calisaya]|uniref:Uncharacterized protein n=1 Tax=Cinchona calisaya TaxID=153742 RepID=A0ABD2ZSB6_9GENT